MHEGRLWQRQLPHAFANHPPVLRPGTAEHGLSRRRHHSDRACSRCRWQCRPHGPDRRACADCDGGAAVADRLEHSVPVHRDADAHAFRDPRSRDVNADANCESEPHAELDRDADIDPDVLANAYADCQSHLDQQRHANDTGDIDAQHLADSLGDRVELPNANGDAKSQSHAHCDSRHANVDSEPSCDRHGYPSVNRNADAVTTRCDTLSPSCRLHFTRIRRMGSIRGRRRLAGDVLRVNHRGGERSPRRGVLRTIDTGNPGCPSGA
jgi:hypothetical protein